MEKTRQILALTKNLLIAVRRLSGDGLALSVIACAMPPLPKGEAFASRKACPLCPRLSLWESWRGAPERARMLTEKSRRSDSIALPKNLLIAAWRLSGDGLALSVIAALAKAGLRLPASASLSLASCWPLPQQRLPVSAAGGGRRRCPQRERLFAPFCSKNFLKIQFIGLLFCYTPVRTKRHRREEE